MWMNFSSLIWSESLSEALLMLKTGISTVSIFPGDHSSMGAVRRTLVLRACVAPEKQAHQPKNKQKLKQNMNAAVISSDTMDGWATKKIPGAWRKQRGNFTHSPWDDAELYPPGKPASVTVARLCIIAQCRRRARTGSREDKTR